MHYVSIRVRTIFFVFLLFVMILTATGVRGHDAQFEQLKQNIEDIASRHGMHMAVYVVTDEGTVQVNERTVMSSASIIKVPILVAALQQAQRGELLWDEVIEVTEDDAVGGSGTIKDMELPVLFTIRELAELMIVVSDNTATNMLMERLGFDEINWLCIELGCVDTVVQNSIYTSMPQDRGPHNYTTVKDMVAVLQGAYEGDTLSDEAKEEFLRIMRSANQARLSELKDENRHHNIQVGRKGGSTASPRVLHDVAIFTQGDQVVYAAAMTQDVVPATATQSIAEIGELIMDYMMNQGAH